VTLERPKLRGTTERFASQLFGTGVLRTNALEALVIASFVRGLSVRDAEATLTEALGVEATVSKSTVSRICGQLKEQYETWSQRRLDDVTLDYLFLDASHFKYHANAGAEPVLAAWGIDTDGKPVFVGLDTAATESGDAWGGFLTDLGERGLRCPLLVISDGAPGLIAAAEQTMSAALRQRCLIHRARNILAKSRRTRSRRSRPTTGRPSTCPTPSSLGWMRWRWCKSASTRWRCAGATPTRPRSGACSPTARASRSTCVSREHWTRVRHSNFIERTFGETRRRVKVIGRLPGEHSVTSLVWAVLDRAAAGWRGFTMTTAGLRLLHDLRRTLLEPPAQLRSRGEPPAAEHGADQAEQTAQEEVRSA